MTMTQMSSSPFPKSVWDIESNLARSPPSSLELLATSSWSPVPEEEPSIPKNSLPSQKATDNSLLSWLNCSTWPRTFAFAFMLCVLCAAAIVPTILVNVLVQQTTTTTTTSTTSTTSSTSTTSTTTTSTTSVTTTTTTSVTTISTTTMSTCGSACSNILTSTWSQLAFYSFDSNTNDITGTYSASGITSPTYVPGYVGTAISLDSSLNQRLWTPAMNLNSKSFTIELWFYLSKVATQDNAFFGQQSVRNVGDQCLFLMSRLGSLYMGFFNDDTVGTTVLQSNTWYHAAFVYDNDLQQRTIYLNGNVEAQSIMGVGPFMGTLANMTIGGANVDGSIGTPYFSGLIDHLTVSTRVKSACEIMNDASLMAYFPFDGTLTDSGPNFLTATSVGASMTSGRVGQAVSLSGSTSYVQISGLTGLGQSNQPFSIAFWVYPIVKGVLIHVSGGPAGTNWCTPFIGFNAAGNLITQVYSTPVSNVITGPVFVVSTWTHIVQTYHPTNGHKLYVNGALYTTNSGAISYSASGMPDYVTIGNILNGTYCHTPGINVTTFQGKIDELHIFNREISSIGACVLAQP